MNDVTAWLLKGDISIRYQTKRDLLGEDDERLRRRILKEGWGKQYMDCRNEDGSWGQGYYRPKWTSSHYTLLELKNLCAPQDSRLLRESVAKILRENKGADGGINPSITRPQSDVCVNGMLLNFGSYFGAEESALRSIIDFLIDSRLPDGGFNCESNRSEGVRHSSLHTTLSVLEGFHEYRMNGYAYRLGEIAEIEQQAIEFILLHQLFISDRSGEIIDRKLLRFTYPFRWKYTILRAMDFFRNIDHPYDARMERAVDAIIRKRGADGRWKLQSKFTGAEYFAMEPVGEPSRWITLLALRVLGCANS
ncbi:MAG: hypothetical protein WBQ23_09455 [Bacteroidota bacterium]